MVGSAQAGPCGVLRQSNLPFGDRDTLGASETLTGLSTQTEGEDMASCPRVCFGAAEGEGESRRPWKVTVRYDRKELQRRLQLEQWLEDAVAALHYEQEPSDLEIDVDDLLELESDEERAKKVRELIQGCAKDPEEFIRELVTRLKGMEKLSTPGKK